MHSGPRGDRHNLVRICLHYSVKNVSDDFCNGRFKSVLAIKTIGRQDDVRRYQVSENKVKSESTTRKNVASTATVFTIHFIVYWRMGPVPVSRIISHIGFRWELITMCLFYLLWGGVFFVVVVVCLFCVLLLLLFCCCIFYLAKPVCTSGWSVFDTRSHAWTSKWHQFTTQRRVYLNFLPRLVLRDWSRWSQNQYAIQHTILKPWFT